MPLVTDKLLDRIKLKAELAKWRALAITAVVVLGLALVSGNSEDSFMSGGYIARVPVDGMILEDSDKEASIRQLAHNKNVKGVIVAINSPGGTIVGSENIFLALRDVAQYKPVVAVMGSLAASGGYMVALGADRILARQGTVTGSIGVLLQSAEITELAQKIGVNLMTFKSSEVKGSPSPFEKLTPRVTAMLDESIKDSFQMFAEMVQTRRNFNAEQIKTVADGRIFTGRQAVQNGLIDGIGGEQEAVAWMHTARGVDEGLEVKTHEFTPKKSFLEQLVSSLLGEKEYAATLWNNGGLLALWKPALLN